MNRWTAASGLAAIGALALIGLTSGRSNEVDNRQENPLPPHIAGKPMVGSSSCAGAGCHGKAIEGEPLLSAFADDPNLRTRSSFTIWQAYDPHANAFAILQNPQSKRIVENLYGPGAKALERAECLACHSEPSVATRTDAPGRALQAQGIGCETCHGGASDWVDVHAGWTPGRGRRDRLHKHGMRDLSNIAVRAETCAGCHIGGPGRDMNHDMVAAGHPRLNFDYGTFIRALPPHWVEKNRDVDPAKVRPASEEFKDWAIGRAAANAASLKLLADRAAHRWPEFAEFDCYACHHNLKPKGRPLLGSPPGSLTWSEPPLSAAFADIAEDRELAAASDSLRRSFKTMGRSAEIAKNADATSAQWIMLSEKWTRQPPTKELVAEQLAKAEPRRWDDACHLYYSLLALDANRKDLQALRSALSLPRGTEGARFNSPIDFESGTMSFPSLFRSRMH